MEQILDERDKQEINNTETVVLDDQPVEEVDLKISWNEKLEQNAKNIGETSAVYKLLHLHSASRSMQIYNLLMIMGICLGPTTGILATIDTILHPDENPTMGIITTLFGMISGITVAIIKFGKYEQTSVANKQAAARYNSIEHNIRRQLSLYRKDRVDAIRYMAWVEQKYEDLFIAAPLLSPERMEQFLHETEAQGITVPNMYATSLTINVVTTNSAEDENVNQNTDTQTRCISSVGIKKEGDTLSVFPELNQCSDRMLAYEMERINR